MQPHAPFLDEDQPIGNGYQHLYDEKIRRNIVNDVWDKRLLGLVSHETVVRRYQNNTDIAIDSCYKIKDILSGDVTITSDHGNLVGEKGFYGHRFEIKTPPLRKVPWHSL